MWRRDHVVLSGVLLLGLLLPSNCGESRGEPPGPQLSLTDIVPLSSAPPRPKTTDDKDRESYDVLWSSMADGGADKPAMHPGPLSLDSKQPEKNETLPHQPSPSINSSPLPEWLRIPKYTDAQLKAMDERELVMAYYAHFFPYSASPQAFGLSYKVVVEMVRAEIDLRRTQHTSNTSRIIDNYNPAQNDYFGSNSALSSLSSSSYSSNPPSRSSTSSAIVPSYTPDRHVPLTSTYDELKKQYAELFPEAPPPEEIGLTSVFDLREAIEYQLRAFDQEGRSSSSAQQPSSREKKPETGLAGHADEAKNRAEFLGTSATAAATTAGPAGIVSTKTFTRDVSLAAASQTGTSIGHQSLANATSSSSVTSSQQTTLSAGSVGASLQSAAYAGMSMETATKIFGTTIEDHPF